MASRKTNDESCRQSSLPKRHLWPSSDDEEKTESVACCGSSCRHPPTPTDNAVLLSSCSSSDEEKLTSSHSRHPCNRRLRKPKQATDLDALHRDNNSFSFKDFLKNGMQQTNYHNTGARPKVYSSPVSNTNNDRDSISGNIYSNRNPTELPDFVQDHLVIEQCYLNQETAQPILPDVDNLPDFALNSMEQRRKTRKRQSRMQNEIKGNNSDLCDKLRSVDLTGTLNQDLSHRDNTISNISHLNHLDLPTFENRLDEAGAILTPPESRGFPFDLPLPVSQSNSNTNAQNGLPGSDTSVHKSLPDFLNDGPIHNKSTDPEPIANMTESAERRLLLENERLRYQLDVARREINEKTEKIRSLEAELLSKREIVHEETANLEKAMEEVEDNLKQSTKRAANAECTVMSLKKKIKTLTKYLCYD
ncbi:uncharacterized protein LOC109859853 isoform X3 [Pseudomyrmex gracilis]|uniref:uncharacterized protein LOC109859853 isoform X3 n=1 Tax=Pseudomyrmex gracilis TaxID=219809 RepID=UPI000994D6D6|nr:uncharacterized protein LOC109859853 isoform X3 [Pseudomyrmex gracilis]